MVQPYRHTPSGYADITLTVDRATKTVSWSDSRCARCRRRHHVHLLRRQLLDKFGDVGLRNAFAPPWWRSRPHKDVDGNATVRACTDQAAGSDGPPPRS